jgi:hypothetical protein
MSRRRRTTAEALRAVLTPTRPAVDPGAMDISGVSSAMSAFAAAQGMFGATAQAAAGVSAPDPGDANGSSAEAVQVAVLQKAVEMERSMVNIFA